MPAFPSLGCIPHRPFHRALRLLATLAIGSSLTFGSFAQETGANGPALNSALDAPLFFDVLIGEIELREGEAATAYGMMLEAAKRSRDDQVFRRATDIALEARAGEQALTAARAWRAALPQSLEAHRYVVQILIALNRQSEAVEPLQALIQLAPESDRPGIIASLPRFFTRASDRKQAGTIVEQVAKPFLEAPATRGVSLVAIGRAWLLAEDFKRALDYAQRAQALAPADDGSALLALELMPTAPAAEALITAHLQARPTDNGVRLVYARQLAAAQRYPDAIAQLEAITRDQPTVPQPWLSLGALHLELREAKEAEVALKRYVELAEATPPSASDEEGGPANAAEGLTQAWLMLSQAAEQRGDFAEAERWLGKIDNPQRALEVQTRRATLLARQGRVDESRALIQAVPATTPEEGRAKLLAEAQVLREAKRWSVAYDVLAHANELYPDDVDLLYEQSMMAEKLDRMEDMERLLRQVIKIKPDHHHAYNALGYSLAERNVRLPEAKALIERALALVPGEPFITDSLGWVEYRLGNLDAALRLLRQAYASRPDTEIGAHLGEVLWTDGQREEAVRIWREAQRHDLSNDVLRETLARLKVEL